MPINKIGDQKTDQKSKKLFGSAKTCASGSTTDNIFMAPYSLRQCMPAFSKSLLFVDLFIVFL